MEKRPPNECNYGPDCPQGVNRIPDNVCEGVCSADGNNCWNTECPLGNWESRDSASDKDKQTTKGD